MSDLKRLIQVTDEEKKKILKEHNTTEQEFEECVNICKEWVAKNDNFSEDLACDNRIRVCLINGKMSLEQAKMSYEGYMTVKKLYEDFFEKLVPGENFEKITALSRCAIMPKLLPNLCRLHIAKITESKEEAEDGLDFYIMPMMIGEMMMGYDFFLSNELLIDLANYKFKIFMKFTPSVNYKLVNLVTSLHLRIHKIHIINPPLFWDKISSIMKVFLSASFMEKTYIHQSLESLYEHIPKEYLPSDYGGTEKSLEELHEMWSQTLKANEERFRRLTKVKIKEIQNQKETINDMGMGVDGSFKRLAID
ncbi:hypothetical protein HHI36_021289 [Cryptolaemus montrouzieri]|uniref:CRAL-TRIO domain-containing protein n=1 Tax=Cryptolaemus montrouzieri TaxID=559131 RepID=A0ABD2MWB0_9CUCU